NEGADIVIADVDEASAQELVREIKALGRRAIFVPTDVSIKADARKLAQAAADAFGRVDILINIAGNSLGAPLEEMAEADFDKVIAIHLKGTFLCSQAAIAHMKKNHWGRIVNIISRAAFKPRVGMGAYSAAKGAILAMSRVLAAEVAQYGINVNCVAPGTALTKMVRHGFPTPEDQMREATTSGVITRPVRLAHPEEIAGAIVFLCSTPSAHITGSTIHVNGGTFMA
ncbi:MAG TPA: SDR family NAD(P)-dependent oxidoreductase, partial [Candidatus Binataceae bacterium]|nr:SDR family NAD(P)-dependent oxidoreductase [Candidatus Binataceae bacterium]